MSLLSSHAFQIILSYIDIPEIVIRHTHDKEKEKSHLPIESAQNRTKYKGYYMDSGYNIVKKQMYKMNCIVIILPLL